MLLVQKASLQLCREKLGISVASMCQSLQDRLPAAATVPVSHAAAQCTKGQQHGGGWGHRQPEPTWAHSRIQLPMHLQKDCKACKA